MDSKRRGVLQPEGVPGLVLVGWPGPLGYHAYHASEHGTGYGDQCAGGVSESNPTTKNDLNDQCLTRA